MRFIHTADWHLGNQMHGIDRTAEVRAFLRWLRAQIEDFQAEALVIAGDVFDSANPSVEARRQYYTFLASLSGTCCCNVVVIGGNHDSAALLDAAKELLGVLGINVVGSVSNLAPEDMCFELRGAGGAARAVCLAVPFVREIELRNLLAVKPQSDRDLLGQAHRALYSAVHAAAEKMRAGRNIPLVATGHLFAADLDGRLAHVPSGERTDDGVRSLDVLGTLGRVPSSVFPAVDYVALGHVHYASMVGRNPAVRYSGSPFVMGFDEAGIPHHVLCVAAEAGCVPAVEKRETPRTFVYRRVSGTMQEVRADLERCALACHDDARPVFLELRYRREIGVSARDYFAAALERLPDAVSVVSWSAMEHESALAETGGGFEAAEIMNLDDAEVFTRLILTREGLSPDSDEARAVLEKYLPLFLKAGAEF